MLVEELEKRWMTLTKSLGAKTLPSEKAFLEELVPSYDASSRMYHSLSHIKACLEVSDKHVPSEVKPWVDMAIFWHDLVYVPGRTDNEVKSALEFQRWGRRMDLKERFIADVMDMIPYTRHSAELGGMHERYLFLVDVDLSILGENEAIFDEYEKGVRYEYSFVPENVFRAGRAKVLIDFLKRPYIYETDVFRANYESMAQANITRSLNKLT
jgi:predicted metal-dependent HD superfamily phosphohydrolase